MGMQAVVVALAVAMAVFAAGCNGGEEDGSSVFTGPISYDRDIQPIWDANCVGCHAGGTFLDLSPGSSHASLSSTTTSCFDPATQTAIEKPALVPGDPAGSALWHKLANVDLNCGREMPPFGTGGLVEIDPAAFDRVESWIREGASAE